MIFENALKVADTNKIGFYLKNHLALRNQGSLKTNGEGLQKALKNYLYPFGNVIGGGRHSTQIPWF